MLRFIPYTLFLFLLYPSVVCSAIAPGSPAADTLAPRFPAHAHNDYMHERPLFDALEHGFRSMEADVFRMGDSLFVAHNRKDISPGRTLRALYLQPLAGSLSADASAVDGTGPLILLVDIKDDGLSTYRLLDHILSEFREILCRMSPEGYVPGQVMVVVSGNRPIDYMSRQSERLAFVDGRLENLTEEISPQLMPLISDRWTRYFSWKGEGPMPEKERTKLEHYVQLAHEKGQMIRFWATPDAPGKEREAVWSELLEAGADLINTDDLEGLREFLNSR